MRNKVNCFNLKEPENMEMWLTVIDSQFVIRGITQELTKFHYVGALKSDLVDRLRHIICKPPVKPLIQLYGKL